MPIDYSKYPPNWKTEIRPSILERANNCCEQCRVQNGEAIFRGFITIGNTKKKEVFQDVNGRVFDAEDGRFMFKDLFADIEPLSGNPNQKAIKVVLTVAHLDHNIENNKPSNLKALCQKHHLNHDKEHHAKSRKQNKQKLQPNLF